MNSTSLTHDKSKTASSHLKFLPYFAFEKKRRAMNRNGTAIMIAITTCNLGAFVSSIVNLDSSSNKCKRMLLSEPVAETCEACQGGRQGL